MQQRRREQVVQDRADHLEAYLGQPRRPDNNREAYANRALARAPTSGAASYGGAERQRRPERGQLHFRPAVVQGAGAARRPVVDHLRVNLPRLLTRVDRLALYLSWPHRTNYA